MSDSRSTADSVKVILVPGWRELSSAPGDRAMNLSPIRPEVFTEAMESVGRSSPLVSLRVTMAL